MSVGVGTYYVRIARDSVLVDTGMRQTLYTLEALLRLLCMGLVSTHVMLMRAH